MLRAMRCAVPALLLVLAACSSATEAPPRALPPDQAARVLVDRNWIDRMPEAHDARLHVYRFVPSMGGGVFQDRTVFRGEFELFVFAIEGGELAIRLPDTGERVRTGYRIERVTGPEPFDLRLTLDHAPRGPAVYYGIARETDRSGEALEQRLAPLRTQ